MIRVSQIKLRPDHTPDDLKRAVEKRLRLRNGSDFSFEIIRQSIDARKKPDIFYVYTVDVSVSKEAAVLKKAGKGAGAELICPRRYELPERGRGPLAHRPVIAGCGPAGLFCALMLARKGYRPVLIERGEAVEERIRTVRRFWDENDLDTDSNVQFGEGGAGTFSDGKLNTSIKDPEGRIRFVLKTFVDAGADGDILYSYRPHIGTDRLRDVVKNIREEIRSLGGEILFSHRLEKIRQGAGTPDAGRYILTVRDLKRDEEKEIPADVLVLALGHSARDTFETLHGMGMKMEQKAFAVGVRIQHPQRVVDEAMYGKDCVYQMPPSPYKLTCRLEQGGVYSFCMCPGGYVVNASSEEGMTAVNGMSLRNRDSGNANAAIVMTVSPEQYAGYLRRWEGQTRDPSDPLLGMAFTRMLERRAYLEGRGAVPAQTFGDFAEETTAHEGEAFSPSIEGKYVMADVRGIFPEEIAQALEEAIRRFDGVIPGFADASALLCAPESRTSSPLRIVRDALSLESVTHPGIYPCGEGAGYAGGITSAAVDGMKIAEKIIQGFDLPG